MKLSGLTYGRRRMFGFVSRLPKFGRFGKNESGALAPVLAVATIPLVLAAGFAVDYGNAVSVQARLQAAVDAAALAAGREANLSESDLERIAQDYFNSNYGAPANSGTPSMELTVDGSSLQVTGTVTVSNYLTQVAGFDTTTISASSEVTKEATGLEVVLVFDNTGSMGSQSRLSTLKVAANDFVEILFGPREVADTLKIAVVPFSQFVNVGPDKADKDWLDRDGANPYSKANFLSNSWHNWRAWESIQNRSWTGCVESRTGALSIDDTPADAGNPDTLFPPAFTPDEPGDSSSRTYFYENGQNYFYNSYLDDRERSSDNLDKRQRRETKYNNARVYTSSRGPDIGCNIQPIQELTNVKSPVLNTINNMRADGYTHVAEGVGWGLRVISPNPPFTEGVSYDDEEITKAMVLLTDGENTFELAEQSQRLHIHSLRLPQSGSSGIIQLLDSDFRTEHASGPSLRQCSGCRNRDLLFCLQRAECHATQSDQELRHRPGKVF